MWGTQSDTQFGSHAIIAARTPIKIWFNNLRKSRIITLQEDIVEYDARE